MATKRAKILDEGQFNKLLLYIDQNSNMPERDRLIVMLSFKAGLRVAEIAKIDFTAMTDPEGRIAKTIHVYSNVAKKNREREVPMHPMVKNAFAAFRKKYPDAPCVAISSQPFQHGRSIWDSPAPLIRMSVNALTLYYRRLLIAAGFDGCSTHSGRRTFATDVSRILSRHHQSIKDLQRLMGHARLDTTERYLEPSNDTFNLVAAI
jgi:integrase/recombinase XerD